MAEEAVVEQVEEAAAPVAPAAEPVKEEPAKVEEPAKGEEPKAVEPVKPVVPAEYQLSLAKESRLGDFDVQIVKAEAKALGLSQEQAGTLLQQREAAAQAFSDELRKECEADPELGGPHLERTGQDVGACLAHAWQDPKDLAYVKNLLDRTGIGNDVRVLRGLARMGRALREDNPNAGPAAGRPGERSTAEVLFGDAQGVSK